MKDSWLNAYGNSHTQGAEDGRGGAINIDFYPHVTLRDG